MIDSIDLDSIDGVGVVDYKAIMEMLQYENERLRRRLLKLSQMPRFVTVEEVQWYWGRFLEALEDPRYQMLFFLIVPIVTVLLRSIITACTRKYRRPSHEGQ